MRNPTVTLVQLHGTGQQQIVRQVPPSSTGGSMADDALLRLYEDPEQVVGSRVDAIMTRLGEVRA